MNEPLERSRPGRPFGLTLAIIATVILFSLIPLLRLALDFMVVRHFNNFTWSFELEDETLEPIFSGADINTLDMPSVLLVAGLSIGFLVVSIFAWRGRPAWIRYVLFFGVLLLDAIYILMLLVTLLAPPDLSAGLTSADSLVRSSQIAYIVAILLASLYLVWYMNRAPARAFYRGYYLPEGERAPSDDVD